MRVPEGDDAGAGIVRASMSVESTMPSAIKPKGHARGMPLHHRRAARRLLLGRTPARSRLGLVEIQPALRDVLIARSQVLGGLGALALRLERLALQLADHRILADCRRRVSR